MARRSRLPRVLLRALCVSLLVWLGGSLIASWILCHRQQARHAETLPDWARGRVEELRLPTRDGEELGAWFAPGDAPGPALLLLHGNTGTRTESSSVLRWLASQHRPTLALTLRAHGDSSGSLNDIGWSARADVIAGVDLLERRASGHPIVIIGRSLGAAAAIYAADELGSHVQGYVLESPYRDLIRATHHRLDMFLFPPLNTIAFAGLRLCSGIWLGVPLAQLSPWEYAARIPPGTHALFLAGTADRHAPLFETEAIAARVPGARLERFDGAIHTVLHEFDPTHYERVVGAWIEQSFPAPRSR